MKHKPHSKLPWKSDIEFSTLLCQDLYIVKDANGNDIAGIEYAGDIDFMEDACNNFQEAISLIEELLLNIKCNEEGKIMHTKVSEFLNKINKE